MTKTSRIITKTAITLANPRNEANPSAIGTFKSRRMPPMRMIIPKMNVMICPKIFPNFAFFVLNWAIVFLISDSKMKPIPSNVWIMGSCHAERSFSKKNRMLENVNPTNEIRASIRMKGFFAFNLFFNAFFISIRTI